MTRLERILDLVHVLHMARGPVSFETLRETFDDYGGVELASARRKFERDKAALAEIGIVLHFIAGELDDEDGYVLDVEASYLPAIHLSADERALLASAARAALETDALPHRGALKLALAKLNADAPDAASSERERPVIVPAPASAPASAEHLEALGDALARRKRVRMLYQKPGAEPTWREISPYALFAKSGVWHVAGHDDLRDAIRLFRVSRIQELEVHGARPTQPDFEIPADFRAADVANIDPLRFELHPPLVCRVSVEPDLAFLMRPSWGEPDDAGVFTVMTTNLDHLVQQVLALGVRAEILEPPEAREAIAAALRATLEAHGEPAAQPERAS